MRFVKLIHGVLDVTLNLSVVSGVFRISKRGGQIFVATSAHTKKGANQVFQFFLM